MELQSKLLPWGQKVVDRHSLMSLYDQGIFSPGGRLAAPAVLHPLWQAGRAGAGRQLEPYHSHYMTSNSFIYFMDAQ